MPKRSSTEIFIEKAKNVEAHKNKRYDYSEVDYKNNCTKVCIICPKHGRFWQRPHDHLEGKGCPKCSYERQKNRKVSNTENFIKKAKQIKQHNRRGYIYDQVNYVHSKMPVIITCPIHGDFLQSPNAHLCGHGCPKCALEERQKKKTLHTEDFIERAKKIHTDRKYNYSKVNYINNYTKVCIICPKHGEFWQKPNKHLLGHGCPGCKKESMSRKLSFCNEEFIKKANTVHNNKYDYSKINYKNAHTPITIICPVHGDFKQMPFSHLNGHGCPECGKLTNVSSRTLRDEQFIKKAKEIHGDKYDYSKVDYVNYKTKLHIICLEHGDFWQTPRVHLQGCGCPECGKKIKIKKLTSCTEQFIKRAKEIHKDANYDYSKVDYINNQTKVCIICSKHGEFWQAPSSHLIGHGCPKCNISHLEDNTATLLQKYQIVYEVQKKFDWLITEKKGKMSLDFYLPNYNLAIECQGIQHFKARGIYTENIVSETKQRDQLKRKLCQEHNIQLYYIDYNENIEEKINNILKMIRI